MLTSFRIFVLATVGFGLYSFYGGKSGQLNQLERRAPLQGVSTFCSKQGSVALTFDEGPSDHTLAVHQALAQANTTVTFHVITRYFSNVAYVTLLEQAYKAGHVIGLRFPTVMNPMAMSDDQLANTLLSESTTIHGIIGKYPKFIRFGDGSSDARIVRIATALGFVVTGWNVDPFDYKIEEIAGKLNVTVTRALQLPFEEKFKALPNGTGAYIGLLHDQYPVYKDASIIGDLVSFIKAYGYSLTTLDKCLGETSAYRKDNADSRPASDAPASVSSAVGASVSLAIVAAVFGML